jgi:hypothetical protein
MPEPPMARSNVHSRCKSSTACFDADIEEQDSFDRIVSSDAIWMLHKKAALGENPAQDCVEVFNEAKLDFSLYLDAKVNAVAVREVGLRHAR